MWAGLVEAVDSRLQWSQDKGNSFCQTSASLLPACSPGSCWRPHWLNPHKPEAQGSRVLWAPRGTEKVEKRREGTGERDQRRGSGTCSHGQGNPGVSSKTQSRGGP